jgi:hypothetical protein
MPACRALIIGDSTARQFFANLVHGVLPPRSGTSDTPPWVNTSFEGGGDVESFMKHCYDVEHVDMEKAEERAFVSIPSGPSCLDLV